MVLTFEALAAGAVDVVLLCVLLRLENDGRKDHPAARAVMLVLGLLLLAGCVAEIVCRGAHILQVLLGIGFNLAFVAYFYSFRAAEQEA